MGVASSIFGLFLLISSIFILNRVLPQMQSEKTHSDQFMTVLETDSESQGPEDAPQESPKTDETTHEDILPSDLLPSDQAASLDANSLFSVSSGQAGLAEKTLDDLNRTESLNALDELPKRISNGQALVYPVEARSKGIEGSVTVNLLVGKDGRVLKALLLDAEPKGIFEESALAVARSWAFTPPVRNQETVQVWLKQTIRFDLEDL